MNTANSISGQTATFKKLGEKIETLIYVLKKLKECLEALAVHSEMQNKAHDALAQIDINYSNKDDRDWNLKDYETYWTKMGLEIQEPINEANAILLGSFVSLLRDNISSSIVELEELITRYSRKHDAFCRSLQETGTFKDNLLDRINFIVCESTDLDDIDKLIRHLIVIRKRSEIIQLKKIQRRIKTKSTKELTTQGNGGQETIEIDSETKEQAWKDHAPEYITNADAVRMSDGKISPPTLSKNLRKPGNLIRWMRNKQTRRSKVHAQDFKRHIKELNSSDTFSEEVFKQRERQNEIDRHKINTGK